MGETKDVHNKNQKIGMFLIGVAVGIAFSLVALYVFNKF